MKKLCFYTLLTLGLFALIPAASAQSFGFGVDVYRPGKALARELDHTPAGVSVQFLLPLFFEQKLSVGTDLGVAMYTGEYYDYEYAAGRTVEVFEEDCFYKLHLMLRYQLWKNKLLMPFLEARTGFTTFFSDRYPQQEGVYEGGHSTHGTAFNTAFGGGFLFNVGRLFNANAPGFLLLTQSVQFMSGTQAEYRDMSQVERAASLDEGVYQSETGMILFNFGMLINLNAEW